MRRSLVAAVFVATLCAPWIVARAQAPPVTPAKTTSAQPAGGFPPLAKDIILVAASVLAALSTSVLLFRIFVKDRILEALRSSDAEKSFEWILGEERLQRRIIQALDSKEGRERLGEILAMPQTWSETAAAAIGNKLPPAMLDLPEMKKKLNDVIEAALSGDTGIESVAAALGDEKSRQALTLFLTGAGLETISAAVRGEILAIIQQEQGRTLDRIEQDDLRARIVRWLDTEQGRAYFEELFQRDSVRAALAKAVLAGLFSEKDFEMLKKLAGMIESLPGEDRETRLARRVAEEIARHQRPNL